MHFKYTKENLTKKERFLQRFFEIIPGLLSWTILLGILILSIIAPITASIIAIAFIFFWFLRLLYMTILLLLSYFRLSIEQNTDWQARIKNVADIKTSYNNSFFSDDFNLKNYFSEKIHKRELLTLKLNSDVAPDIKDIINLVIFPVAKEPQEIINPTIEALAQQRFPLKQLIVIITVEETAPVDTQNAVLLLQQKYKNTFKDFLTVIHPKNSPSEAKVKGANATFAAKEATKYLKSKNILSENVIVSCFDADTVVNKDYFTCLTYNYMITPDRTKASYQPIPMYHNNIWNVTGFSRVMEMGSSFFQLIESTNPDKLVTFSSHSMSFKALEEINYWPVDMISDDSAIFWKAYLHYEGQYKVVPIYTTLSMDATVANTWLQTVKNVYKQKKRWAYGVENFPILMRGFLKSNKISFHNKFRHSFKMLENHISWATGGFLITTLGWLPAFLAGKYFYQSVISYNQPHIAGTIFRLSSFSLLISIFLSISLLPKATTKYNWLSKIQHAIEWLFIPFALVFLSTLPALDAQTKLMFGKYMEFWVTDKSRKDIAKK